LRAVTTNSEGRVGRIFPLYMGACGARHYFHFGKLFAGPRVAAVHNVNGGMGIRRKSLFGQGES
jgi:hypothetical protein